MWTLLGGVYCCYSFLSGFSCDAGGWTLRRSPALVGHQSPRCLRVNQDTNRNTALKAPISLQLSSPALRSLSAASCHPGTSRGRSPPPPQAPLVQVLTFTPAGGSGHSLRATLCIDVSSHTSSVWVEAPGVRGVPVSEHWFSWRQVPPVLAEARSASLGCRPTGRLQSPSCTLLHTSCHAVPWLVCHALCAHPG